jgi:hypothetical protein
VRFWFETMNDPGVGMAHRLECSRLLADRAFGRASSVPLPDDDETFSSGDGDPYPFRSLAELDAEIEALAAEIAASGQKRETELRTDAIEQPR